jgi:hypothetical protein
MSEINAVFERHIDWVKYFYDGEDPPEGEVDLQLRTQLDNFCEALMDFVDSVVKQQRSMPASTMDWSTWEVYFRYLYGNSPILREHISENLDYYPDYTLALLGLIVAREPLSGVIVGKWTVREIDLEKDGGILKKFFKSNLPGCTGIQGFPWARTWLICRSGDPESCMLAAIDAAHSNHAEIHVRYQGVKVSQREWIVILNWIMGRLQSGARLEVARFITELADYIQQFFVERGGQLHKMPLVYDIKHPKIDNFLLPEFASRKSGNRIWLFSIVRWVRLRSHKIHPDILDFGKQRPVHP